MDRKEKNLRFNNTEIVTKWAKKKKANNEKSASTAEFSLVEDTDT